MTRCLIALAFLLVCSPISMAEDDPMEVQRCIWRCMNSVGTKQPAYDNCIAANCDTGGPKRSSKPIRKQKKAAGKSAAEGEWTFGNSPELGGLTAHVRVKEGSIGLACSRDAGSLVMLRISNTFFASNSLIFALREGGGQGIERIEGSMTELQSDACGIPVGALRTAGKLYLIDGFIKSISAAEGGNEVVITQNGRDVVSFSPGEFPAELNAKAIPLTGSAAAIDRMLRHCPAVRSEVMGGCGD